jgi:hypothetical protein
MVMKVLKALQNWAREIWEFYACIPVPQALESVPKEETSLNPGPTLFSHEQFVLDCSLPKDEAVGFTQPTPLPLLRSRHENPSRHR